MHTSAAGLFNALFAASLLAATAMAPARAQSTASAQHPDTQQPTNCATASDCATGEFCDTTPKCPGSGAKGVCKRKPSMCTSQYLPVTGCNGREYSNACVAASDGQPHTGPVKGQSSSSARKDK